MRSLTKPQIVHKFPRADPEYGHRL